jgi:hypothetical protein
MHQPSNFTLTRWITLDFTFRSFGHLKRISTSAAAMSYAEHGMPSLVSQPPGEPAEHALFL